MVIATQGAELVGVQGVQNRRLLALSVVSLFSMLWLPLGQQEFLRDHWMKIGTFVAPFLLLTYSAIDEEKQSFSNTQFVSVLLLIAYIAHQFEEHWVDLFGNHYAFFGYVNDLVCSVLGLDDEQVEPLTAQGVFIINTSLVWLVGVVAIARSRHHLFPLMALAAITLVNGVTHILASVITLRYNPGLLTSLVLFLPLTMACYLRWARQGEAFHRQNMASIAWAVLAHALMVGGMLAANVYEMFPESVYFGALILWSLLPVILFQPSRTNLNIEI